MERKWLVFACAVACLVAIPVVVNILAFKLGGTLSEERRIRALLYWGICVALLGTIFGLWLLEGK